VNIEREIELPWIGDGLDCLLFETAGAAVPELRAPVAPVDQRRRVSGPRLAADANGDGPAVGEGASRIVTRRAGTRALAGQQAIREQAPAECDLLRRQRIVLRDRHVEIQSQRNDQHEREEPGRHHHENPLAL